MAPKTRDPRREKTRPTYDVSSAPYWIQVRDAERRLLRGAYEACAGDRAAMSSALGVGPRFLADRIKQLGGVLPDDPVHEPPLRSRFARSNPEPIPPQPRMVRRKRKALDAELRNVDPAPTLPPDGSDQPADPTGREGDRADGPGDGYS